MKLIDPGLLIVRCAPQIREAFLDCVCGAEDREPIVVLRVPSAEVEGVPYYRWRDSLSEHSEREKAEAVHIAAERRGEIHVFVVETITDSREHVLIEKQTQDDGRPDELSDADLREARDRRAAFIRRRAGLVRLLEPRVSCPRGCGALMRPVQYETSTPVAQVLCAEKCPRCHEEIRVCRPPLLQLDREGLAAFLPARLVEKIVAEAGRVYPR
ncbi:MAG: hypothetical protein ACOX6T_00755 [Myxococcales bacterium]|jgi:hypothetical protein